MFDDLKIDDLDELKTDDLNTEVAPKEDPLLANASEAGGCLEQGEESDKAIDAYDPEAVLQTRLKQIREHSIQSQFSPDGLMSGIAGVTADMLEMEAHVSHAILPLLQGADMAAIRNCAPCIDLVLRLSRQIAGLAQMDMQCRNREVKMLRIQVDSIQKKSRRPR